MGLLRSKELGRDQFFSRPPQSAGRGIRAGVFWGIDTFIGYTSLERTLIVEVACQEDLEVAVLGFEIERPRSGLLRLKKKDSVVLIPRGVAGS
jgi:hypothetical protein